MSCKKELVVQIKSFLPQMLLVKDFKHKGNCGYVAIIGGSEEYTGAPYFAAITALRIGCDLAHVICPEGVSAMIKSFSPDLIVHPWLDRTNFADLFDLWLNKFNIIVLGPGMGRLESSGDVLIKIVAMCREKQKPLIVDADGLYFASKNPEIFKDYSADLILTPNAMEFSRIAEAILKNKKVLPQLIPDVETIKEMQEWFGKNSIIFHKGQIDLICAKGNFLEGDVLGSPRRCGGQGDLLAGALATFFVWANQKKDADANLPNRLLACYAASSIIRKCSNLTYSIHGRGMIASDMVHLLTFTFKELFEI